MKRLIRLTQICAIAAAMGSSPVCQTGSWISAARAEGPARLSRAQRGAEKEAMGHFAAGRYQDAVEIYSKLYADHRDPVYLRNIGRCYQRLKDADRAVSSFQEYLLKAKNLSPAEREEIEGFIAEMRAHPAAASAASVDAGPRASAVEAGPTQASTPNQSIEMGTPAVAPSAGVPALTAVPVATSGIAAEGPQTSHNGGVRWVGTGALILSGALAITGGVLLWASWSKYHDADGKCSSPDGNSCSSAADSIASQNLWSQIMFGGAIVSGATGGLLLLLYPSSAPGQTSVSGLHAGVAWTY